MGTENLLVVKPATYQHCSGSLGFYLEKPNSATSIQHTTVSMKDHHHNTHNSLNRESLVPPRSHMPNTIHPVKSAAQIQSEILADSPSGRQTLFPAQVTLYRRESSWVIHAFHQQSWNKANAARPHAFFFEVRHEPNRIISESNQPFKCQSRLFEQIGPRTAHPPNMAEVFLLASPR